MSLTVAQSLLFEAGGMRSTKQEYHGCIQTKKFTWEVFYSNKMVLFLLSYSKTIMCFTSLNQQRCMVNAVLLRPFCSETNFGGGKVWPQSEKHWHERCGDSISSRF